MPIYKIDLHIPIPKTLYNILKALSANNLQALLVGGAVRDAIMGYKPKDMDIEVYGTNYDSLLNILKDFGKTNLVGKSFGIIKLVDNEGNDYDFSLPRRDSLVGSSMAAGRGFEVEFDPSISPKEAASRRDFTMNALAYDPLRRELHDYFNGLEDIEYRVLRATSPAFAEDPLRVLRGMQFASRFNMTLDPETAELAKTLKNSPLVKERIVGEWMKAFIKGKHPSKIIQYLIDTEWIDNYPELKEIVDVPQDPIHHPEGTVDVHTSLVMDAAARIADDANIQGEDRAVLIIAAMCHDLGKATTTELVYDEELGREKVTAHGHHTESARLAQDLLDRIGIKKSIIDQVIPLVEHHMDHVWYDSKSKQNNVRQIAEALFPATIEQLEYVIRADIAGRISPSTKIPEKLEQIIEDAKNEDVYLGKMLPLLRGRDIINIFNLPSGKIIGDVLGFIYNKQLEGTIKTKEEAIDVANKYLRQRLLLIDGNDIVNIIGKPGPAVGRLLEETWQAQLNKQFNTRDEALTWLELRLNETSERYGSIFPFIGVKELSELLLKYAAYIPTVGSVAEKYNIDPEYVYSIARFDPDFNSADQSFGSIGMWLLKQIRKGNLQDDEDSVKNALQNILFLNKQINKIKAYQEKIKNPEEFKKWIGKHYPNCSVEDIKDAFEYIINQSLRKGSFELMIPEQLHNIVAKFRPRYTPSIDINDLVEEDVSIPYYKDDWVVIVPKSYEASVAIGEGTRWCVSFPENDEYYRRYVEEDGKTLYMIINMRAGEKFCALDKEPTLVDSTDDTAYTVWRNINTPSELNDFLYEKTKNIVFNKDFTLKESILTAAERFGAIEGLYELDELYGDVERGYKKGYINSEDYEELRKKIYQIIQDLEEKFLEEDIEDEPSVEEDIEDETTIACRVHAEIQNYIYLRNIEKIKEIVEDYSDIDLKAHRQCSFSSDSSLLKMAILSKDPEIVHYFLKKHLYDQSAAEYYVYIAGIDREQKEVWNLLVKYDLVPFSDSVLMAAILHTLYLRTYLDMFSVVLESYIKHLPSNYLQMYRLLADHSEDAYFIAVQYIIPIVGLSAFEEADMPYMDIIKRMFPS